MSTIPELIAKLSSDQAGVDEAAGSVESSRHDVGQLIAHFEELGAGDSAAAASLRHTEEQLEHVRHGLLGGMAKAIETARRLVEQSKGHPTTAPSVPVGDPRAVVGDAVTAPEPKPGPNSLRREHADPDEGDKTKNKVGLFTSRMTRNMENIKSSAESAAENAVKAIDGYTPNSGSSASVEQPQQPSIRSHSADIQVPETVTAAIVFSVVAVDGVARLIRLGRAHGNGSK